MNTQSETETGAKRKAISYVRFSTLAQGNDGRNSTTRQRDALNAALAKWNLELDATFTDAGKSGYHQRHLAKGGAMHELRKLALKGALKGKIVVVEDWDRTGRMQTTDAAPLILDMLNNGVDMVVGAYGGEYFSKDVVNANPFLLYRALDEMNRGFGESKRKTEMAKAKWKARFEAMKSGKPVALNSLPFWLVNERDALGRCTGKVSKKEGMEKLIKEIYAMYVGGEGSQVIANKLNERGIPLPPRRDGEIRRNANVWHATMIQKVIKNRALIGYYHGTDYKIFPPIIDEATFYRANKTMKGRIRFSGRRAEHVNPYAGLTFCAKCGRKFSRHSSRPVRATQRYDYLQCRNSKQGLCSAAGMPYHRFEETFARFLGDVENIYRVKSTEIEPLQSDALHGQIATVDRKIANTKAAFMAQEDPAKAVSLGTMLTELDTQRAQLAKDLEAAIILEKGTSKLTKGRFEYLRSLFGTANKLQDPDTRREIQEALRESVERIEINVKTQSYTVQWKQRPEVYKVTLNKDGSFTVDNVPGEGYVPMTLKDMAKLTGNDPNFKVAMAREQYLEWKASRAKRH